MPGTGPGTRRGTTMVAFGPEPRLFRIHRAILSRAEGAAGMAATRLLAAISRVIRSAAAKAA